MIGFNLVRTFRGDVKNKNKGNRKPQDGDEGKPLTCWDRFKGNFSWLRTTYYITD
jgi:hypothetical protein